MTARTRVPAELRCVVTLGVDFDGPSHEVGRGIAPLGIHSWGRYSARCGVPRLMQMLTRHGVPCTFFVPGYDARCYPDVVRAIDAAGFEAGAHGYLHEAWDVGEEEESQLLHQTDDILRELLGKPVLGWRSPSGRKTQNTMRVLKSLGYLYDASFQDDDHPYLFAPNSSTRLVEVPGVYALDDAPVYSARHTHARLMKIWREEFDALYEAGCLVPLTLHLRGDMGSTRAARIVALDEFFSYVAGRPGVRFMTGAELAALTLSSGMNPEPDPVAMHQSTLSVTPYRGDLAVKPI